MDALASSVSSNLSTIFGESKGVAIAQALISTYAGIAKAIETYPPPIAQAMAAVQAAAGFAQVANIRSTTKSGGGGGGSSAAVAAPAAVASAAPQQAVFLNLHGDSFGRDQVRGLVEKLIEYQKDGGRLVLAR